MNLLRQYVPDVLGATGHDEMYRRLRSSNEGVLALLTEVAASPTLFDECRRASYFHANGFYKLVAAVGEGFALRLHLWTGGKGEMEGGNLHSHRWDIASQVLLGKMRVRLYGPASDGELWAGWSYRSDDGADALEPCGGRRLRLVQLIDMGRGGGFSSPHDVIHHAEALSSEAMTLVVTSPRKSLSTQVFSQGEARAMDEGRTGLGGEAVALVLARGITALRHAIEGSTGD